MAINLAAQRHGFLECLRKHLTTTNQAELIVARALKHYRLLHRDLDRGIKEESLEFELRAEGSRVKTKR